MKKMRGLMARYGRLTGRRQHHEKTPRDAGLFVWPTSASRLFQTAMPMSCGKYLRALPVAHIQTQPALLGRK